MALSGIETLHPDVFVIEERGFPRIIGVGVNTGGAVGVAEKGPVDRADLVTNYNQFVQKYGAFHSGSYLEPSVRAFFDQGGTRLIISRVIGLGAAVADEDLANQEGAPAMDANAISPGAWGNNLALTTEQWRTSVAPPPLVLPTPPVANGSVEIPLLSLRNIQRGDLVEISDPVGGVTFTVFIYGIDVSRRTIKVRAITGLPFVYTVPVGALVHTASQHRLSTTLTEDLAPGADNALLARTSNLAIGARIYFDDGTTAVSAVVERIDGLRIRFAPLTSLLVTLPKTFTIAVSQEFGMFVFEGGAFRERFDGLSMEITNERDYFGSRLSGESNESKLISVDDLFATPLDLNLALPKPVVVSPMSGGTEGAPIVDADFIGSDTTPKSGMFLLGDIAELNFFAIPGITSVAVQKEQITFAEKSGIIMTVLDPPLADDEPLEVIDYRNIELNSASSYAALYYPWVVVRDPTRGNAAAFGGASFGGERIILPPSGFIMGQYAETGETRGVHFAPANVELKNVLDLTYHVTDGEQDLLNPIGINCLRAFPGEGIRIWGARTLSNYHDGSHYVNVRRLLNFIKASLRVGLRFAIFELNDPRTWTLVTSVTDEFLRSMWLRGMLFPSNDRSRAYFVKCDEETNPISEIREGRMNVEVGVNPPFPAEFVVVRVGIWDGGSTVEEEIARR